jgi:hypothetical protein
MAAEIVLYRKFAANNISGFRAPSWFPQFEMDSILSCTSTCLEGKIRVQQCESS